MPKCPYCSCDNFELNPMYGNLRGMGYTTPMKCGNCTCSQKPNH